MTAATTTAEVPPILELRGVKFVRTVLGVADWTVLLAHGVVQRAGPTAELGDDVLATAYLGGT